MALRFGFWNLGKKRLADHVRLFAGVCDLDVIVLAEVGEQSNSIAVALSSGLDRPYRRCSLELATVQCYSRLPADWISPVRDDPRSSYLALTPAVDPPILIVGVHLPSPLRRDPVDLTGACRRLAEKIEVEEEKVGHRRTMVIGDFNVNPFDDGLMLADSLQAVSDRRIVQGRRSRRVDAEERLFFYNCMWGFLGDHAGAPPGTYFYETPKYRADYWNVFDQVLLRPDLVAYLTPGSVSVVTQLDSVRLETSDGRPSQDVGSDHFPITIALNIA